MDKQTHEQLEAELTTLYQHDPSTAFIEQLERRLTLQAAAMTTQPARIKWRHKLSHIFSPTSGRLAFALGAFALLLIPLLIIYATRPLPINNSNQLVDRTQPTTTTGDSIAIIQPSQYNALAYVDDLGFIISDNAAYLTKKVTRTVALRDTGFAGWPDQGTLVVRSAATNEQASEFNVELHLDFTEPISRSDYIDDYFDMLNTDYAAHFDIQSRSHIRLPNGITYTVESNKNNQPCNYNNIYIDTLTTWCTGRILKTLEPLPIGTTNVVLVLSDISYHRPKAEAWEIPLNLTPVSEIDPLKQPEIQLFSTSDWAGDTKIISDSHQGITLELVAVAYGEEFTSVLLNSYTDARYNMTPSAADLFPPRLLFGDHTAALLVEDTYFKREDSKTKTRSYLPKNPELQPLFHDNAERSGTQRMQFNSTAPLLNGLV
ncbi:MAG TPA: hypothetical protein ENJ56_01825, partial [Anaerolineae bacterium]|nr:hypothetical protein [Anaerolineae bacterium]